MSTTQSAQEVTELADAMYVGLELIARLGEASKLGSMTRALHDQTAHVLGIYGDRSYKEQDVPDLEESTRRCILGDQKFARAVEVLERHRNRIPVVGDFANYIYERAPELKPESPTIHEE